MFTPTTDSRAYAYHQEYVIVLINPSGRLLILSSRHRPACDNDCIRLPDPLIYLYEDHGSSEDSLRVGHEPQPDGTPFARRCVGYVSSVFSSSRLNVALFMHRNVLFPVCCISETT